MNRTLLRAVGGGCLLFLITVTSNVVARPAAVLAPQSVSELPDGEGQDALIGMCTTCHTTERIVAVRQDLEGWTEIVDHMVRMGAYLPGGSEKDRIESLVSYLETNFGPADLVETQCSTCHDLERVNALLTDSNGWSAVVAEMRGLGADLDDDQARLITDYLSEVQGPRQLVETGCTTCHSLDTVSAYRTDRDGWSQVLETMMGYGAVLEDQQQAFLVDFLNESYGARALLEDTCTVCHNLDRLDNRRGSTRDEWQTVVNQMINLGAQLPPDRTGLLLDFLGETYGGDD